MTQLVWSPWFNNIWMIFPSLLPGAPLAFLKTPFPFPFKLKQRGPNNACSQGTSHFKNFVSSRTLRDNSTNIFKSCMTTEPFRLQPPPQTFLGVRHAFLLHRTPKNSAGEAIPAVTGLLRLFWSCQHNFCFRLSTLINSHFLNVKSGASKFFDQRQNFQVTFFQFVFIKVLYKFIFLQSVFSLVQQRIISVLSSQGEAFFFLKKLQMSGGEQPGWKNSDSQTVPRQFAKR